MCETHETPLVSIRSVSHIFPNGYKALSNVSLDVHAGECLLIAGSNGSGKTLLMRITCGLVDPTSGSVSKSSSKDGSLKRIGMVFQDADSQIVGETAEEDAAFGPRNLGCSKSEAMNRAHAALSAMGLLDKREFPPRRLSGGEKRRLAVAGVLAMGCAVVIMDEPFANLDYTGVVQTLEAVRKLKNEGKTLIILTHELEKVLAFADRLVILDKGEIRDQGAPEEVLDRLIPAYGIRDPRKSYSSAADCTWLD